MPQVQWLKVAKAVRLETVVPEVMVASAAMEETAALVGMGEMVASAVTEILMVSTAAMEVMVAAAASADLAQMADLAASEQMVAMVGTPAMVESVLLASDLKFITVDGSWAA